MKQKIIYILTILCHLSVGFAKPHHPVKIHKSKAHTKKATKKLVNLNGFVLKKVSFGELPGWNISNVKQSYKAFQNSCNIILQKGPSKSVGTAKIKLKAKDWFPACKAALSITEPSEKEGRDFFEKWFHPVEFKKRQPVSGLFTGYYMPLLRGSNTKTEKYKIPIYGLPAGNARKNFTREQIDKGALQKKAPVLAWVNSPVERLFLEIEGAGVIQLPDGKHLYLGYAGENGASYTSIGAIMIRKGLINRDHASSQGIKKYLEQHPQKIDAILHANKSFVFFENLKKHKVLGADGIALTPGYSLAVDKKWIPLGAPLWLNTKKREKNEEKDKPFQSLMIAQDTGGAIRGVMRGDVYWGWGKKATYLGEHMKNAGIYWLLLPKHLFNKGAILM